MINIGTKLENIQTELRSITNITDIFPSDNIIIGLPSEEFKEENYCFLTLISDNVSNESDNYGTLIKTGRIAFNIVASNSSVSDVELFEYVNVISNEIVTQGCDGLFNFDGFIVSSITEDNQSNIIYTNNRPSIIKDYLFKYKI